MRVPGAKGSRRAAHAPHYVWLAIQDDGEAIGSGRKSANAQGVGLLGERRPRILSRTWVSINTWPSQVAHPRSGPPVR